MSTAANIDPNVMRRLQNLLKRRDATHSNDGSAQAGMEREAELAAKLIQDLLTEHGLSMGDIAPEERAEQVKVGDQFVSDTGNGMVGRTWVRWIVPTIAELCFCQVMYAGITEAAQHQGQVG